MKTVDIIEALAQKVIDTIYDEWHHDGYIEITHSDNFYFTLDGRTYKVTLEDIDCAGSPHQAAEAIEKLQSELEQAKEEIELYKNTRYKLQHNGEELTAGEIGERLDELKQVKAERDEAVREVCRLCRKIAGMTNAFTVCKSCDWRGVQGGKEND